MRYYKFVINGVENVKSFKNSDSPPRGRCIPIR